MILLSPYYCSSTYAYCLTCPFDHQTAGTFFRGQFSPFLLGFFVVLIAHNDVFNIYISSTTHCVFLLLIFGWKCFIMFQAHLLIYGKNKIAVIASQKRLLRWPKLLTTFLLVSTLVSLGYFFYHLLDTIGSSYENVRQALEYNYIIFNGKPGISHGLLLSGGSQVVQRISS